MHCGYFDTTQNGNHSSFLTQTVVGGGPSLPSEICTESDSPLPKNADFDRFPIITSQPQDSKKFSYRKSTTGFSTSFRRSAYITPKSLKRWLKKQFKKIKFKFNSIKSATKFLRVKTCSSKVVVHCISEITSPFLLLR